MLGRYIVGCVAGLALASVINYSHVAASKWNVVLNPASLVQWIASAGLPDAP